MWIIALLFLISLARAQSGPNRTLSPAALICRNTEAMVGHDDCYIANSTWATDVDMNRAKEATLKVLLSRAKEYPAANASAVFVYIHGYMARGSPAGMLILDKILNAIDFTGLLNRATVYLVAYGDIQQANLVLRQYNRVTLISQLKEFGRYYEYPTLALMQHHAMHSHPDSKFLYMHTKGVTSFEDRMRAYLRSSMIHFAVHLYEQSLQLLSIGWEATGITYVNSGMDNENHYAGNYFWTKASVLGRNINIRDLIWHWRFGAERWPLSSISHDSCRAFKSEVNSNVVWLAFLHDRTIKDIPEFNAVMEPPKCP